MLGKLNYLIEDLRVLVLHLLTADKESQDWSKLISTLIQHFNVLTENSTDFRVQWSLSSDRPCQFQACFLSYVM